MRKLLLTTTIALPLTFGAAFAQETPAPADDPAAESEPLGTDTMTEPSADPAADPMAEPADDPAADPVAEPADDPAADMGTDPAADPLADPAADPLADPDADPAAQDADTAAMEAEMAASDKIAREQAANELRLEWITDATVTAPDGTSIGSINDLIVDGESGSMIAAIVGVGGFLGIGAKQIAVPFDQLTINFDAQEVTSDLTKEEADAAPEYVFRDRDPGPEPVGDAGGMGGDGGMADPAAPAVN